MTGFTRYMKTKYFNLTPFNRMFSGTSKKELLLWMYAAIGLAYLFSNSENVENIIYKITPLSAFKIIAITVIAKILFRNIIFLFVKNTDDHHLDNNIIASYSFKILISFCVIMTFLVGVKITNISFIELLDTKGVEAAARIFSALASPNMSVLHDAIVAAIQTLFMAFIATILAIPFAFILSLFGSNNIVGDTILGNIVYYSLRGVLNFTRSVEPLVWAIIFSVWVGIGPFAGILALMIHSITSLAKLYSEQIEIVSNGPIEAMLSVGANKLQIILLGIVPQVIPSLVSLTIYRWDINLRMATIIGLVGGGGIGTMLIQYQGLGKWNEVGTIIIVIACVVSAMDYLSSKLRKHMV